MQANPACAVGLCWSQHNEFKRATLYGDQKLKPLREFYNEMKAQYQTSLGLGKSFAKDTSSRGRRRARRGRGSFQFRGNPYFRGQGFVRGQVNTQSYGGAGLTTGSGGYSLRGAVRNRRYVAQPAPLRAREVCFDFQSGNCLRGRGCRFTHANQ